MKLALITSILLSLAIISQAVPLDISKRDGHKQIQSNDDEMLSKVKQSMDSQGLKIAAVKVKKVEEVDVLAVQVGGKKKGHKGGKDNEDYENYEGYENYYDGKDGEIR
ncbi:hypothetical protein RirG_089780 [Rhizophagus irregularis DAOM 197198w]|uniref:Uncharacterized protein n=1 Tax=Rhizophagus irregularis (strain DAOM 197198w) TaxID=1432141 RepID=A0A015JSC7_RHIIW|nr:hypothetical protein RirG_089780 [Rhizophagus irregularis DAOM 197198w]